MCSWSSRSLGSRGVVGDCGMGRRVVLPFCFVFVFIVFIRETLE